MVLHFWFCCVAQHRQIICPLGASLFPKGSKCERQFPVWLSSWFGERGQARNFPPRRSGATDITSEAAFSDSTYAQTVFNGGIKYRIKAMVHPSWAQCLKVDVCRAATRATAVTRPGGSRSSRRICAIASTACAWARAPRRSRNRQKTARQAAALWRTATPRAGRRSLTPWSLHLPLPGLRLTIPRHLPVRSPPETLYSARHSANLEWLLASWSCRL